MWQRVVAWFWGHVLVAGFQWARKNGGRLPFAAYEERVKTWHTSFVDLAIIHRSGYDRKKVQILLQRRPEKGYVYPGMWDIPGGNVGQRESLLGAAWRMASLLGGFSSQGEPLPAGVATYTQTPAEVGISHLFVLEIQREWPDLLPVDCKVFSLDCLPADIVPWQAAVYPDMIRRFLLQGPSFLEEYLEE